MILIGQFDSPFVRRVAIAMRLYGIDFIHERWSVFGDADRLGAINPLRRVPTLVLDDGVALTDSAAIIDWLDDQVGRDRALFPATGEARRDAVRVTAFLCGLADKAVSLFYELRLHDVASELWIERCRTQIGGTLAMLEAEKGAKSSPYWGGEQLGHADIATACVFRFVNEAHPGAIDPANYPALGAIADRCEAMDVFRDNAQPFIPPT